MQRRDFLTRAPIGLAAIGTSVAAAAIPAPAITPVMAAYRDWKRSLDAWTTDMERDDSDENGDRWCNATFKLADAVLATPSTSSLDFVYKLMAYCFNGQHELSLDEGTEPLWAEARALVGVPE